MQRGFPSTRHHWCRSTRIDGRLKLSKQVNFGDFTCHLLLIYFPRSPEVDNNQVKTANLVAFQHYIGYTFRWGNRRILLNQLVFIVVKALDKGLVVGTVFGPFPSGQVTEFLSSFTTQKADSGLSQKNNS